MISLIKYARGFIKSMCGKRSFSVPGIARLAGRGKCAAVVYLWPSKPAKKMASHSNKEESYILCEEVSLAGYKVDVYFWNTRRRPSSKKYSLIIGFGDLFEHWCRNRQAHQTYIMYSTGAYLPYQNEAEMRRVSEFRNRTGSNVNAERIVDRNWPASHFLSDEIWLIGNDWTKSTYPNIKSKIFLIRPTSNSGIVANISEKTNRRGLLWLGAKGCLHKGLDLVIDAVNELQGAVELHICGDSSNAEVEFWSNYDELPKYIFRHGFLSADSSDFKKVASQCSFVILPSCSEGMATSVLAGMSFGLVPIVTTQTGINAVNLGVEIEELNVSSVIRAIQEAIKMSESEYMRISGECCKMIEESHTLSAYRNQVRQHLVRIMNMSQEVRSLDDAV